MTHTEKLYQFFLSGGRIADHQAYQVLGFTNLRSRVCTVEKKYNVIVNRQRVPGKHYNVYFIDTQLKLI